MTRRNVLALLAAVPLLSQVVRGSSTLVQADLETVIAEADRQGWSQLPIGELMGKIGQLFLGVPYVSGTLEGPGVEICRIELGGMDCVTFYENVLGIARMIKLGGSSMNDLRKQITLTRYRGGVINGYQSRLHYTADWILDNVAKKTVVDITHAVLNGRSFDKEVDFMSSHPKYYPALNEDRTLIDEFKAIEEAINDATLHYVPKEEVPAIESKLQTGDIVAITTSKNGLDYAHTGLILVRDSEARFMHASTSKKKVTIDVTISRYLQTVATHTGITVVRPLEPVKT